MSKNEINLIRNLYKNFEKPVYLHNLYMSDDDKNALIDQVNVGDIAVGNQINNLTNELSSYFKDEDLDIGLINSGTSALHLSLASLNLNDKTDILISPITFISPVNAIKYSGSNPFFLDINPNTLNMSPESLEEFLNNFTKKVKGKLINTITGNEIRGLIHVDVFGQIGELDKIYKICKDFGIYCIEDAAESFGSKLNNFNIGKYCDLVAGSFNGNKIISGGGGGFVGSKDSKIVRKIVNMANHSKIGNEWEYDHGGIGYNYRISNLQASLVTSQLKVIDEIILKKRKLHKFYNEYFANTEVNLLKETVNNTSNYWLNAIQFNLNKVEVENILTILNKEGIKCRKIWKIMTEIKHYKQNNNFYNLENSKEISDKVINIPSGLDIYKTFFDND